MQLQDKYMKGQECSILLQGVNWPALIPVASVPHPPVQARPTAAPPLPGPQYLYHLPQNRVGQAVVNRKSAIPAQHLHTPVCPPNLPAQPLCLLCPTPALPLALLKFHYRAMLSFISIKTILCCMRTFHLYKLA